jgi:ribonuclease T2
MFDRKGAFMASRILNFLIALVALIAMPVAAMAEQQCRVPQSLPAPKLESVGADKVRQMPVTDYLLTLSWSPQYCRSSGKGQSQCARGSSFGFVLHGLWPEGPGASWPQYCKPVSAVPTEVIRMAYCATPSVNLIQHEWGKHGSCMTDDPARYFKAATTLYGAIKSPDMNSLSRARPDAAGFITAFVAANPGLRADSINVQLSKGGWLEEVRICLGTDFKPQKCAADKSGARPREQVKIWRAER